MSCLLQVSDTHFGTEQASVVASLERFALARKPDILVLSGDITQRATAAQFDAARAFVRRLGLPSAVVIPGNHDIPLFALYARILDPYGRYRTAFGVDLAPAIELEDCLVVGVNTTRWYRHTNGEISTAQVERVASRLERAGPARLRVVVVHQPVAVTRAADHSNLLRGRERAVKRWADAGADLILGGHIHLPYVLPLDREFSGLARNVWCVQAGTAVSSRVRAGAPNSVNLIRHDGGAQARRCVVERWDFIAASERFECVHSHDLDLAAMATSAAAQVAS